MRLSVVLLSFLFSAYADPEPLTNPREFFVREDNLKIANFSVAATISSETDLSYSVEYNTISNIKTLSNSTVTMNFLDQYLN